MSLATSMPGMMLASLMPRRVSRKSPTGVAKKTRFPAATARGPLKVISRTRLTNLGAPPRAIRTRPPSTTISPCTVQPDTKTMVLAAAVRSMKPPGPT